MKWLIIAALAAAVGLSGCGKKKRDAEVESTPEASDSAVQADTATLDATANAETLPTIDTGSEAPATPPPADTNANAAPAENTPTPSMESAPAPVTGSGKLTNYSVQRGDTLMKIAFNVYGDIDQWKTIFELNKDVLQSANILAVGSALKYDKPSAEPVIQKNGEPYLIKQGDTLGTIADDVYAKRSKWKKIYENNRGLIKDPNRIYAGFYLYYQVTEEEKREADEIRARRGNKLGTAEKLPDSASNTTPQNTGSDALKAGGLNNLAAPAADRAPASDAK